ncbi:DUF4145 domain-containing protein [Vibrio sp. CAU 1672]|uniref:DUF4145 domain-containing protein n=1 Tax=Vibrio sp. CAU 1672 TaxID=3032594 RepID=UPI0023D9E007|nr:DUF4145 domain-containing protein [Vibrio sp. CAU 1672]MDF2153563.1 DUF4145 domain-containing protein [Vibrio sp. CAU 1672]
MNTLNDIEFLNSFDEEIGLEYERAKRLYKLAPIQTLIILRGLATNISLLMLTEVGEEERDADLYDLIVKLRSTKFINGNIIDNLHQIRIAGNKAAHPEQFSVEEFNFSNLAKETLLVLCDTIELIRTSFQGREAVSYGFTESTETDLEDMTYRALFANDPQAKFDVATALIQKRNQRLYETFNNDTDQMFVTFCEEDGDELRNALHLLESSSNYRHADSQLILGLAYIDGLGCEVDMEKGINCLSVAAYADHDLAKAYFGYFLLELDDRSEEDTQEALRCLEESAQKRNPLALNVLSTEYASGILVEKDLERSLELLTEAANLGFPESQFKLAEYYLDKNNLDDYWLYINRSLSNGHVPSLLSAGRTLARQSSDKEQLGEALSSYSRYIEITDDPIARFEFGLLVLRQAGDNPYEIKKGLQAFVFSYRNSDCPTKIKKEIEKLCPKHLKVLGKFFIKMSFSDKEDKDWTAFYCQFNSDGHPFNSQETMLDSMLSLSENLQTSSVEEINNKVNSVFYIPKRATPPQGQNPIHHKIGRNNICPLCNSGKKYKHCCGR